MGRTITFKGIFVMALDYATATSKYEPTLGLEVHVELKLLRYGVGFRILITIEQST